MRFKEWILRKTRPLQDTSKTDLSSDPDPGRKKELDPVKDPLFRMDLDPVKIRSDLVSIQYLIVLVKEDMPIFL